MRVAHGLGCRLFRRLPALSDEGIHGGAWMGVRGPVVCALAAMAVGTMPPTARRSTTILLMFCGPGRDRITDLVGGVAA